MKRITKTPSYFPVSLKYRPRRDKLRICKCHSCGYILAIPADIKCPVCPRCGKRKMRELSRKELYSLMEMIKGDSERASREYIS